jgi:hypothetical protein
LEGKLNPAGSAILPGCRNYSALSSPRRQCSSGRRDLLVENLLVRL